MLFLYTEGCFIWIFKLILYNGRRGNDAVNLKDFLRINHRVTADFPKENLVRSAQRLQYFIEIAYKPSFVGSVQWAN